jgi:phosphatidylglycerophosphatase A
MAFRSAVVPAFVAVVVALVEFVESVAILAMVVAALVAMAAFAVVAEVGEEVVVAEAVEEDTAELQLGEVAGTWVVDMAVAQPVVVGMAVAQQAVVDMTVARQVDTVAAKASVVAAGKTQLRHTPVEKLWDTKRRRLADKNL